MLKIQYPEYKKKVQVGHDIGKKVYSVLTNDALSHIIGLSFKVSTTKS